jgi:hypothetical protein
VGRFNLAQAALCACFLAFGETPFLGNYSRTHQYEGMYSVKAELVYYEMLTLKNANFLYSLCNPCTSTWPQYAPQTHSPVTNQLNEVVR